MNEGLLIEVAVIRSWDSVLLEIHDARHHFRPNLIRLKNGSQSVVVLLRDRIVFVVMAFAAIESEAEHRFGCVFDGFIEPTRPIEFEILTCKKAGRAEAI